MPNQAVIKLAEFLRQRASAVKALEDSAAAIIATGDQAGYAARMREKAELLRDIADDAEPLVSALENMLAEAARARLEGFTASASTALGIGSVFFMSALLYPDEHKPGEPNNLELFAEEVAGWA